jgi:DNA-binding transcriptional regulator YiaG
MTPASLKSRREQLGLSQAELARQIDISVRTLQNWEIGHRGIPSLTARWLSEQLRRLERRHRTA